jgi:hypothetical protein
LQLIQVAALALAFRLRPLFFAVEGIGISQFVYIGPAIWIAHKHGQDNRMKGLIIAASLVALLNAACWGVFLGGGMRIGG